MTTDVFLNDQSFMLIIPSLNGSLNYLNEKIENVELEKLSNSELSSLWKHHQNGKISCSNPEAVKKILCISTVEGAKKTDEKMSAKQMDITPETNMMDIKKSSFEENRNEAREVLMNVLSKGVNKIKSYIQDEPDMTKLQQLYVLEKATKNRRSLLAYFEVKLKPYYQKVQDEVAKEEKFVRKSKTSQIEDMFESEIEEDDDELIELTFDETGVTINEIEKISNA